MCQGFTARMLADVSAKKEKKNYERLIAKKWQDRRKIWLM